MEIGILQHESSGIQNNDASDSDDNLTELMPTDSNMTDEITSRPSAPESQDHAPDLSKEEDAKDDAYVMVPHQIEENASSVNTESAEIQPIHASSHDTDSATRKASNASGEIRPAPDEAPPKKEDPAPTDDTNNQKNQPDPEGSKNGKKSDTGTLCSLIKEELKYMENDPQTLQKYGAAVKVELDAANIDLKKLTELLTDKEAEQDDHQKKLQESLKKELHELKKRVTKLKAKFPSKVKIHKLEKVSDGKKGEDGRMSQIDNIVAQGKTQLFSLHDSKQFANSEVFRNFQSLYDSLDSHLKKLCLLTFSVFPENAMIRKRIMIYWWMADGFIKDDKGAPVQPNAPDINVTTNHYSPAKETGAKYLKEFTEKGFIIPTIMKPGSAPHSYQVHPMARIVLISLAKTKHLFDFKNGSPTETYEDCLRACLVGDGLANSSHLEKLHMIFNIDESIVEFKKEWFPKMENLNILHLGRWQSEEKHHIEIEDPDLLDQLQHLKFLKFLSLQGVSRVIELPDSIKKLGSLKFLDLRACHNLEVIPTGLGDLTTLTHLDISDCYLIDHLPKEISQLKNLLVLKGFIIVGDTKDKKLKKGSCTIKDLGRSLSKLKKLGIYTSVYPLPEDEVEALQKFKELWTLSISWGSTPKHETTKKNRNVFRRSFGGRIDMPVPIPTNKKKLDLPESLVKLELNCYPGHQAPPWMKGEKLPKLKKLYIGGGKLQELGSAYEFGGNEVLSLTKKTWNAEIVRLKYLACMDMSWREFRHLFPNLIILENVNCPKLTLFPTDNLGVWCDKTKLKN